MKTQFCPPLRYPLINTATLLCIAVSSTWVVKFDTPLLHFLFLAFSFFLFVPAAFRLAPPKFVAWFFNLLKSNFHSRGLACFSLFSCAFLPLFPSLSFSSYRPPPVFGSTSPIPYSTAALLWAFLFHMLAGLFLFFFFFFSWGYVLARHHGKPEHSRKKWVYVADQDGKTEGKIHPRQLNQPALLPGRRLDHESKHFSKFLSSGNVDARKLEKRGEKNEG